MDNSPKKIKAVCTVGATLIVNDSYISAHYARTRVQEQTHLLPQTMHYKHTKSDLSPRLVSVPECSGGILPEANPQIGAPMATFVYGGISPDKPHPQMPLIKGPSVGTTYTRDNGNVETYNPGFVSQANLGGTIGDGTNSPSFIDPSSNSTGYTPSTYITDFNSPQYPTIPSQTAPPFNNSDVLPTYNIWGLHNIDPKTKLTFREFDGPIWPQEYQGPRISQVVNQAGTASVQVVAQNTIAQVERMYPIAKDLAYSGANLYYPALKDPNNLSKVINKKSRPIKAIGGENCGFQLHFNHSQVYQMQNSNTENSSGGVEIIWGRLQDDIPSGLKGYMIKFRLVLTPDQKPQFYIYHPRKLRWELHPVEGPTFGGGEFHVYVHYAGPVMLIGFDAKPSSWSCITPFEDDQNKSANFYIKVPVEAKIKLVFKNITSSFQYGPIAFNNFNPENAILKNSNGVVLTSDKDFDYSRVHFSYVASKNTPDIATSNTMFQKEQLHHTLYNSFKEDMEATPTVYRDSRESVDAYVLSYQSQFGTSIITNPDLTKTVSGEILYETTIEGPVFLAYRDAKPPQKPVAKPSPIISLPWSDITSNLKGWNVSYKYSDNSTYITGNAEVQLVGFDSSPKGRKILSLINENVLSITLGASFEGMGNNQNYFQGVINNYTVKRGINGSVVTLHCTDIGTEILSREFFKTFLYFGGMRYRRIIEYCLQSGGLLPWYLNSADNTSNSGDGFNNFTQGMLARLGYNAVDTVSSFDLLHGKPTENLIESVKHVLDLCIGIDNTNTPNIPALYWDATSSQMKLDWRNNPKSIDKLFFWGQDDGSGNKKLPSIMFGGLDANGDTLDGVLDEDGYTINGFNDQLHSGIYVGGFNAILGGPLSYKNEYNTSSNGLFRNVYNVDALNQPIDKVPENLGFVGYDRRFVMGTDSRIFPDQKSIEKYGKQLEQFLVQVHETIEFSCFISKPLTISGQFQIADLANPRNTTGNYFYNGIDYKFDAETSELKASIEGIQFPSVVKKGR